MGLENKPQTDTEADLESLADMLEHFEAFSKHDLHELFTQFETGESDEV